MSGGDRHGPLRRRLAADPQIPEREELLAALQERSGAVDRIALISDIHANLEALTAVLDDIRGQSCQRIACLGDLVGYGAEPAACVDLIRDCADLVIIGNHDAAAIGGVNVEYYGAYAREVLLWTRKVLRRGHLEYLASLRYLALYHGATLVHGSLYRPELFDYIQTTYDAYLTLQILENPVCFVGHSHVPITFFQGDRVSYTRAAELALEAGVKALVNVGSVGQPRDEDPRACYAIYDRRQRRVSIRRVPYDIEAAIEKMRRVGLPEAVGERLRYGR